MWYLVTEYFRNSGRLSQTRVVQLSDAEVEAVLSASAEMGSFSVSDPFETEGEAREAEASRWEEEK